MSGQYTINDTNTPYSIIFHYKFLKFLLCIFCLFFWGILTLFLLIGNIDIIDKILLIIMITIIYLTILLAFLPYRIILEIHDEHIKVLKRHVFFINYFYNMRNGSLHANKQTIIFRGGVAINLTERKYELKIIFNNLNKIKHIRLNFPVRIGNASTVLFTEDEVLQIASFLDLDIKNF